LSRGIGFYLDLMNLIERGSVTLELDRERKVASVTVTRDEIAVDIGIPGLAYDVLYPLLVVDTDREQVRAIKRGTRWKSNTMMVRRFLRLFSGIERTFNERGKVLRMAYRGRDVIVIGPNERSIMARLAGLRHVSLPHKFDLLLMVKDFWLSKPDNPDR